MTEKRALAAKSVNKFKCWCHTGKVLPSRSRIRNVMLIAHHIAPAQLVANVNMPTAATLYPPTPLYAFERSIEDMAFDPPKAKKAQCWSKTKARVSS